MKKLFTAMILSAAAFTANAADYIIDTKGAHASINFKIQHLGYSWLVGRFNDFDGSFSYDKDKLEDSSITVNVDVTSLDSNHAERDKHLKSADFLEVSKFPKAKFVSTGLKDKGNGKFDLMGDLTLKGVTKPITIEGEFIGEGKDPWGGYRAGFMGTTKLTLKDFNIDYNLGPASTYVEMDLHVEGIRK